jgi:hypothetical protein
LEINSFVIGIVLMLLLIIITTVCLKRRNERRKTDRGDFSSYVYDDFLIKLIRKISVVALLLFLGCHIWFTSLDLVYFQTNGNYVVEENQAGQIDIINFIDHDVLEITNDGVSNKVIYEKIDNDQFKFSFNENGNIHEYTGEVKKESGKYYILLMNETQIIKFRKVNN